ncbi:rhomboid family intramembrane serine protease [Pseudoruegeria sp. SK021]|uniref:rhomboid family intramembrane serine protease n=1 Tax=Pseudoruegeria sp. SK021 TaxID=1933035 RepID=UPI0019806F24|nr:rhomboid family intramembrane serine protease [Pseudoruegeria sp. SK021]
MSVELVLILSDHRWIGPPGLRRWAYDVGAFWLALLNGAAPEFHGQSVTMFVTYAFLHGGALHLLVNMIALFSLGNAIVRRIGQKRFLVAYAVSTVGGSIGFALLSTMTRPMVGASGALFGLMGIWVCWDFLDRKHYGESLWATGRALTFLILYNVVFFVLLSGQLAWETHLGGFVAGWLLAIYWGRDVHLQGRRRMARTAKPGTNRRQAG